MTKSYADCDSTFVKLAHLDIEKLFGRK